MSFEDLLTDTCMIYNRTVDETAKTAKETFTAQSTLEKCRVMKRAASTVNPEKTQHGMVIRTVIAMRAGATVSVRDRILHENRMYEVIEVIQPRDGASVHHKNCLCEGVE